MVVVIFFYSREEGMNTYRDGDQNTNNAHREGGQNTSSANRDGDQDANNARKNTNDDRVGNFDESQNNIQYYFDGALPCKY